MKICERPSGAYEINKAKGWIVRIQAEYAFQFDYSSPRDFSRVSSWFLKGIPYYPSGWYLRIFGLGFSYLPRLED